MMKYTRTKKFFSGCHYPLKNCGFITVFLVYMPSITGIKPQNRLILTGMIMTQTYMCQEKKDKNCCSENTPACLNPVLPFPQHVKNVT